MSHKAKNGAYVLPLGEGRGRRAFTPAFWAPSMEPTRRPTALGRPPQSVGRTLVYIEVSRRSKPGKRASPR